MSRSDGGDGEVVEVMRRAGRPMTAEQVAGRIGASVRTAQRRLAVAIERGAAERFPVWHGRVRYVWHYRPRRPVE